jgi:alkylation response protein AidB-like acyl-CoA dehydrogenase
MELDLGPEIAQFRAELRDWIAAEAPAPLAGLADWNMPLTAGGRTQARIAEAEAHPAYAEWAAKLAEARLVCPQWPEEFGGQGMDAVRGAVLNEEFYRAGVPRVTRGMGEWLVGPSIIVHGSDEQKAKFLPRIISGKDRYCQGFSEPDAGSDLASLKTRGVVDGDEIVITGQKVWTSGAQMANMMFCLCRTDPDVPKHQGISYVLVPMKTADGEDNGFELRGLRQLTGTSGFTETFITEARAPLFNVIGGLNNGWRVTMTTLGNERGGNATTQHVRYQRQFWRLVDEARRRGRADDPVTRQKLAWAYTQTEIMRYAGLRTLSEVVARKEPGPGASINKMFWSEYARDVGEWAMNLRGADAMIRPDGDGYALDRWQAEFLGSRSGTIWGGTAQVQRNIVGERVLGLPKEPGHNAEDR